MKKALGLDKKIIICVSRSYGGYADYFVNGKLHNHQQYDVIGESVEGYQRAEAPGFIA